MENVIRKIVQEELRKALSEIYTQQGESPDEDDIIYDFEFGRSFGINKLSREISGLDEYYMSSYFPHSEMEESWMFEINTNYGGSQIIDIVHKLGSDYKSYWKLNIAELERGSDSPTITKTTGFIQGYDNFIKKVNSSLENDINPYFL